MTDFPASTVIDRSWLNDPNDDPSQGRAAIDDMATTINAITASYGDANGICDLDSSGKVPLARLPATIAGSSKIVALPFYFAGEVALAGAGNFAIAQKVLRVPEGAFVVGVHVAGVDGLDTGAAGATMVRASDVDYAQAGTPQTIDLTLAHGEYNAIQEATTIEVGEDGLIYVFATQATGGHYGISGFILYQYGSV